MAIHIKLMTWDQYRFKRFQKTLDKLYPIKPCAIKVPHRLYNRDHFLSPSRINYSDGTEEKSSFCSQRSYASQSDLLASKAGIQLDELSLCYFEPELLSLVFNQDTRYLLPVNEILNGLIQKNTACEKYQNYQAFSRLIELCSPSQKNMVDFLLDFFLSPSLFIFSNQLGSENTTRGIEQLKRQLSAAGNLIEDYWENALISSVDMGVSPVFLCLTDNPGNIELKTDQIPPAALKVLVSTVLEEMPTDKAREWDLLIYKHQEGMEFQVAENSFQNWISVDSFSAISRLIHLRGHTHYLHFEYARLFETHPNTIPISVIITTYQRQKQLREAIKSVLRQSIHAGQFEVIIVNNDPTDHGFKASVDEFIHESDRGNEIDIQVIDCPVQGLSAARNAALVLARGEIVCFLDDDAIAEKNWLCEIQSAYEQDKLAGVVGGQIILNPPTQKPKILKPGLERFWSEFITDNQEYTLTKTDREYPWGANWSARRQALLEIGGFRLSYGRKGNDFSGGEEIIAASLIHRSGFNVGIMPSAVVFHEPVPSRYSLKALLRTIQSQIVISYRMSRDGYLDRTVDIHKDTQGVIRNISKLSRIFRSSPREVALAAQIEYLGYILGWFRVLKERIIDFVGRLVLYNDD